MVDGIYSHHPLVGGREHHWSPRNQYPAHTSACRDSPRPAGPHDIAADTTTRTADQDPGGTRREAVLHLDPTGHLARYCPRDRDVLMPSAYVDEGMVRPCMLATCWVQGMSGTPTLPARVMNRNTQALLDTGSMVTLLCPELAGERRGNRWRSPVCIGTPGHMGPAMWSSGPHIHGQSRDCTPPAGTPPDREGLPDIPPVVESGAGKPDPERTLPPRGEEGSAGIRSHAGSEDPGGVDG